MKILILVFLIQVSTCFQLNKTESTEKNGSNQKLEALFDHECNVGCSRYTGKVTDDKYRPVEVKANAKRSILAILGHSDSFVGVRK